VNIDGVRAWVAAAVADGWAITPTYGDHEPVERAARLTRDGFVVQALMRDDLPPVVGAAIHVWGPDSLTILVPQAYSYDSLVAGLRVCSKCRARDVDTQRVGFAGRVCAACLPAARKVAEYPGWTS
jgi:hypothetical protein